MKMLHVNEKNWFITLFVSGVGDCVADLLAQENHDVEKHGIEAVVDYIDWLDRQLAGGLVHRHLGLKLLFLPAPGKNYAVGRRFLTIPASTGKAGYAENF